MPRGIPKEKVAGNPMTSEELAQAEERVAGKRAPLHEDDFKEIENKMVTRDVMQTADGRKISRVGQFQAPQVMGHESTLKRFARIRPDYTGWIKMGSEEVRIYQELKLLIGHDGDEKLGLIDERKLERIKKEGKNGLLSEKDTELLAQLEEIQ